MRGDHDRPWRVALAGVAMITLACVSRSPQLATTAPTLLIRVERRPDPATPLMIWAVPAEGERLRLGLLTSASSNVVRFDRVSPTTVYRFVAERSGGASITSSPFTPGRVAVVAWDLSSNTITPVDTTRH